MLVRRGATVVGVGEAAAEESMVAGKQMLRAGMDSVGNGRYGNRWRWGGIHAGRVVVSGAMRGGNGGSGIRPGGLTVAEERNNYIYTSSPIVIL
ncbi:UNVERIFIED_CONTAM: hypothetical protein Sangu_2436400 [Sesamum angustifolium]|uniref:Uncharacterized protein n=1 Tax=Sesamum angustifolium TaxID=2727405 RepID=A0AAW2KWS0_9LAMI